MTLPTDDQQIFLFGLHSILDELERLTQNDSKQRQRVSAWIAKILSDLAVVSELQRQMSFHQPWASTEITEVDLETEYQKQKAPIFKVSEVLKKGMNLEELGSPLSKFDYPSDKRRTAQRTRAMIEAEANLDRFWQRVDEHIEKETGMKSHEKLRSAVGQRELRRTPIWREPAPTQTQQSTAVNATTEAFLTLDLEERTESTLLETEAAPTKAKIKTRGQGTDKGIESS